MHQVHVVGSSASLQHAPISTPALFAQLVYRTSRLCGGDDNAVAVQVSASTTGSLTSCAANGANTVVDPTLQSLAAHVSGASNAATSSSPSLEGQFGPGTVVEPYPFFDKSFFEIEQRFHATSSAAGNLPYDVIVCADADAFDSVSGWFSSNSVASSSFEQQLADGVDDEEQQQHPSGSSRRRRCCVVAHIPGASAELQSRLPMLYSNLVCSLVAAAAAASASATTTPSSWAHAVDTVVQKFLAVRNAEVMYSVIG
jgi:hypothetical protein